MTYAKHIVAAAALLASFGVAHAEEVDAADRAAFYESLQPRAAAAAPVVEGRQAARIVHHSAAAPTEIQTPVQATTDAERYIIEHNTDANH